MTDYRRLFKSCGEGVEIAADVYIERPERLEVGDRVKFMRGFYMMDGPQVCRIGADVAFFPNCFIQGSAGRFIIDEHVTFYPNTYISLGGESGFLEIGHHTHFAPGCVV